MAWHGIEIPQPVCATFRFEKRILVRLAALQEKNFILDSVYGVYSPGWEMIDVRGHVFAFLK